MSIRVVVRVLSLLGMIGSETALADPASLGPCPDRGKVMAASAVWVEANQAKDLERAVALYEDDAMILAPGERPAVGRDAIREFFRSKFAEAWRLVEFRSHVTSCQLVGNLAVATADNQGRIEKGDKTRVAFTSKSLMVYRRGADGKWRFYRDIWNASPTVPSPATIP